MEKYLLDKTEEIFQKNKLIGNYDLSEDDYSSFLEKCSFIVNSCINKNPSNVPQTYHKLIFLVLVEITKRWKDEDECDDEESDDNKYSYWNYVYKILRIRSDYFQKAYKMFENIITSLGMQKIIPVVEKGKKYYATIMMHALAPKKSMDAFFELCLNIYKKDLDLSFTESDIEFCAIAAKITSDIFSKIKSNKNGVTIGSSVYSIKIGLRALSMHKDLSDYYIEFFKHIFILIDKYFCDELNSHKTRIERQLSEWINKITKIDKKFNDDKKIHIATVSKQNINVKYAHSKNETLIIIPAIRIDSINQKLYLEIFVGDNEFLVHSQEIPTKIGEITVTTKQLEFDLNDIVRKEKEIKIRVIIKENNVAIFDSKTSNKYTLDRDFILFDNKREIFTQYNDLNNYFVYSLKPDYLLQKPEKFNRINTNLYNIYPKDGEKLFGLTKQIYFFEHSSPTNRNNPNFLGGLENAEWRYNDDINCEIFSDLVILQIPETTNPKEIELNVDNNKIFLAKLIAQTTENGFMSFDISKLFSTDKPCKFSIFSYIKNDIILTKNIVVFHNFSLKFNNNYYYGDCLHNLIIGGDEYKKEITWTNDENQIVTQYKEGELIIKIPYICWKITDNDWENKPCEKIKWYKDYLSASSILEIISPVGLSVSSLILQTDSNKTNKEITEKGKKFEIGRVVYNLKDTKIAEIKFIYRGIENSIIKFAMKEQFDRCPLVCENSRVYWRPQIGYIGDKKSEFIVEILSNNKLKLKESLSMNEKEIGDFEDDLYNYNIFKKSNSIFSSTPELIQSDVFCVGNPNKYKFKNKYLQINGVYLLAKSESDLFLKKLSSIYLIKNIEYYEYENQDFWIGSLCVICKDGKIKYLDYLKNEKDIWEVTNPIRLELRDNR
ncbi:MAG: hypothetical protein LBV51_01695, partial [Acholeplasmatales bacterium]|nr:hypothetical protein [Acholeplasmatales bacterium]